MDVNQLTRSYIGFLENLGPDNLSRLADFLAPQVRFSDPFNDARGLNSVTEVFRHMFEICEGVVFEVKDHAAAGNVAFLRWDFGFGLRGTRRRYRIEGVSRVEFGEDGLVISHVDYWDAAQGVYEQVPLVGFFMRRLRKSKGRYD